MSYSLIIIDMQKEFPAARSKKTQTACAKAIRKAIRDNAAILFVEYSDNTREGGEYSRTVATLSGLVDGYKKAYSIKKEEDDGGEEVVRELRKHNLPHKIMRVCGVNTSACVLRTVRGIKRSMRNHLPEIQVLKEACNAESEWDHCDGIQQLRSLGAKIMVPKISNKS